MDVDLTNMRDIEKLEAQAKELSAQNNKMTMAYDKLYKALLDVRLTNQYRRENNVS